MTCHIVTNGGHRAGEQAVPPGLRSFVIAEIDAKSSERRKIRRSLQLFKITIDLGKTCHVMSSKRVSNVTNKHHCERHSEELKYDNYSLLRAM